MGGYVGHWGWVGGRLWVGDCGWVVGMGTWDRVGGLQQGAVRLCPGWRDVDSACKGQPAVRLVCIAEAVPCQSVATKLLLKLPGAGVLALPSVQWQVHHEASAARPWGWFGCHLWRLQQGNQGCPTWLPHLQCGLSISHFPQYPKPEACIPACSSAGRMPAARCAAAAACTLKLPRPTLTCRTHLCIPLARVLARPCSPALPPLAIGIELCTPNRSPPTPHTTSTTPFTPTPPHPRRLVVEQDRSRRLMRFTLQPGSGGIMKKFRGEWQIDPHPEDPGACITHLDQASWVGRGWRGFAWVGDGDEVGWGGVVVDEYACACGGARMHA